MLLVIVRNDSLNLIHYPQILLMLDDAYLDIISTGFGSWRRP